MSEMLQPSVAGASADRRASWAPARVRALSPRLRQLLRGRATVAALCALSVTCLPMLAAAQEAELPPAWTRGGWTAGPEEYGVRLEAEVPLRMRDGTILKAEVLYPASKVTGERAAGRFPILLEHTPFRCRNMPGLRIVDHARYFVARGYVYAVVQARGTCNSEGSYGWLSDEEARDGIELIDWAAYKVDGTNGRLGLIGCSYPGALQFLAMARAEKKPPVLAMAATGVGADIYQEVFFPGGTLTRSGDLGYWSIFGWGMGQTNGVRSSLAALADIRSGGPLSLDGRYWKDKDPGSGVDAVARMGIPVFNYTSWDDIYSNAYATTAMLQSAAAGRSKDAPFEGATASPKYQVMVAPGEHCSGGRGGPRDQATLAWLDTWVKGSATGIDRVTQPFHLHATNSPGFKAYSDFPFVKEYTRLYLSKDGGLSSATPLENVGEDEIARSDIPELATDPSTENSDTISYETAALKHGARLTGPGVLRVFASTNNGNMLLVGDVYDVAPDGTAKKITTGSLIASMRGTFAQKTWKDRRGTLVRPAHDFTGPTPVQPGAPLEMQMSVLPRMWELAPGHRIRLVMRTRTDVSFCTPGLQRSYPCIVGTVPQQRSLEGGRYAIQRNKRFASYLALPIESPPEGGR